MSASWKTSPQWRIAPSWRGNPTWRNNPSWHTPSPPNPPSPPTFDSTPAILSDGDVTQPITGDIFTASVSVSGTTPITTTYQWQKDTGGGFANIVGATSSTYTVPSGQTGNKYRVVVGISNIVGNDSANSNESGVVVATTTSIFNVDNTNSTIGPQGVFTTPFQFINTGTIASFRCYGYKVTLKNMQAAGANARLWVNGVLFGTISSTSYHDEIVWHGPEQWVLVEVDCRNQTLYFGTVGAWVQVIGTAPAIGIDPAIGRRLGPTGATAFNPVNATVIPEDHYISLIAKADSMLIRTNLNSGYIPNSGGWTNDQPQESTNVVVSQPWGTFRRVTLGGDPLAAKEHLYRLQTSAIISDILLQGGDSSADAPTTVREYGLVVTGTSLTTSVEGVIFGGWSQKITNNLHGRVQTINLGIGGSPLYPNYPGESGFKSSFFIKDQIVDNLNLFANPIFFISHLCNDVGNLNVSGVPKTPTEFKDKLVELVEYIIANVPNLYHVFIGDIETHYQEAFRPTWSPALPAAVAELNGTYPGLCTYIATDQDVGGGVLWYQTVAVAVDNIHPTDAGCETIALHHGPYIDAVLV